MKFLRRSETETPESDAEAVEPTSTTDSVPVSRAHTPGKGRATPKRREAEAKRRGPVAPPPRTSREAMKRGRGTKEERKEQAARRRDARVRQRERMMAGDERALPPRERGPVKAYVRDLVDSQRTILGLFMPLALVVMVSLFVPSFVVQQYATLVSLLMFVAMIGQGVLSGRKIAQLTRQKFPKENIRGLGIGWYAFSRGIQLRRLRVPKPRVQPGQQVA